MAAPLQALPDFALPAGILNDERETPLDKSSAGAGLSSPPLGSVQSRRAAKDPSSRKTVPHQVRVPGRGGGGGHVKQNSSAFPSLNPDSDDEAAPTAAAAVAAAPPSDASDMMMMDLLSLDAEAATARQQLLQLQQSNANAAVAAAVSHQRQPSGMAVENSFMVPQHLRRMHVSLTEQQYLAMADARSGGGGGGATGRSGGAPDGRSRHDMLVNPLSPSMSQAGTPPTMCSPRSSRRAAAAAAAAVAGGAEFSDLSSAHLFNAVAAAAR
jgi:hypothetical protein